MKKRFLFLCLLLQLTFGKAIAYEEEVLCDDCPGECYYNACRAGCLAAGIIVGVAVFAGMIAVVVKDGSCSHSH